MEQRGGAACKALLRGCSCCVSQRHRRQSRQHTPGCASLQDYCTFDGVWRGPARSNPYYVSSYFWDRAQETSIIRDKDAITWTVTPAVSNRQPLPISRAAFDLSFSFHASAQCVTGFRPLTVMGPGDSRLVLTTCTPVLCNSKHCWYKTGELMRWFAYMKTGGNWSPSSCLRALKMNWETE